MKNKIANFLFEATALKRLQRTGWQILGENKESVAAHTFMVNVISYLLAKQTGADIARVLVMSLFHDFIETRVGDIYKLADLYVTANLKKAADDVFTDLPENEEIIKIIQEYEEEKTLEARIVHDADKLALCLELKQLVERGNKHAKEWLEANLEKLHLSYSQELAVQIKKTDSQDWWRKEREKIHKNLLK